MQLGHQNKQYEKSKYQRKIKCKIRYAHYNETEIKKKYKTKDNDKYQNIKSKKKYIKNGVGINVEEIEDILRNNDEEYTVNAMNESVQPTVNHDLFLYNYLTSNTKQRLKKKQPKKKPKQPKQTKPAVPAVELKRDEEKTLERGNDQNPATPQTFTVNISGIGTKIKAITVNKSWTYRKYKEYVYENEIAALRLGANENRVELKDFNLLDDGKSVDEADYNKTLEQLGWKPGRRNHFIHQTSREAATIVAEHIINKETFIKTSKAKMNHYAAFPTLTDYTDSKSNESGNKTVTKLTQEILSEKPSGDPRKRDTLLHVLDGVAKLNGKKCMFFDSSKGINSELTQNSYLNVIDGNDEKAPKFVVTLNNLDQFVDEEDEKEYNKTEKLIEMKQALTNNIYNPIINDIRNKLAMAHNVSPERIIINDVYENGVGVAYHVTDLTESEKNKIITESQQFEGKMRKLFNDYKKCAIHPALLHNSYDISMFDERGNKTFSSGSTFKVGPPGKEREYIQPKGWTRYGLKVLGKPQYGGDKWLHPFQDPGNWYRAYHGTSREAGSSIYKTAFRSGSNNRFGKGIYCTPKVDIAASYCSSRGGTVTLQTQKGLKKFYFVFQVAVNPDKMNNPAYIKGFDPNCEKCDYWIAPTGADIRPYGILIKEV